MNTRNITEKVITKKVCRAVYTSIVIDHVDRRNTSIVDSSNTDLNPIAIQALLRSVFDESTITSSPMSHFRKKSLLQTHCA